MRMQGEYTIHSVDKIDVSINMGIQKQYSSQLGTDPSTMCTQGFDGQPLPTGVKTEQYDDGEYVGCIITGTMSADQTNGAVSYDESTQTWTYRHEGNQTVDSSSLGGQDPSSVLSDFSIKVTFPGPVESASEGGKIEGNSVTWTDPSSAFVEGGIHATAKNGANLTWLWIVLGVVGVAAIAVVVWFLMRGKKKPAGPEAAPGQPFPPQPYPTADQQAYPAQGQQPYPTQGQQPYPTQGQQPYPPQQG